MTLHIEIYLSI